MYFEKAVIGRGRPLVLEFTLAIGFKKTMDGTRQVLSGLLKKTHCVNTTAFPAHNTIALGALSARLEQVVLARRVKGHVGHGFPKRLENSEAAGMAWALEGNSQCPIAFS